MKHASFNSGHNGLARLAGCLKQPLLSRFRLMGALGRRNLVFNKSVLKSAIVGTAERLIAAFVSGDLAGVSSIEMILPSVAF